MAGPMHRYSVGCAWRGSTGVGYDAFERTHTATVATVGTAEDATLTLSGDPAFRGDGQFPNPEQLLVLAASSCQLLSFLAVAARARLDIVEYRDEAEGVMPSDSKPERITRIVLRPVITVRGDVAESRLAHLCEVAHRECYIANSLTTDIVVEPTFTFVAA